MSAPGKGGDGVGVGSSGDLYIVFEVVSDPRFVREGTTLYSKVEISFAQATLGDQITIEGVGGDVDLDIPAGTQPGSQFRVKHAGLPRLHGGTRGDMVVEVQVRVPKKVSEAEIRLIRELAELGGEDIPKGSGSILGGLFKKKK
jgi:molecular chaperone DnaJ